MQPPFWAQICFSKLSRLAGEKTTAHICKWKDFESAEYLDDVEIRIETEVETEDISEPLGTRLTINGDDELLERYGIGKGLRRSNLNLKKLKSPVSPVFKDDEFRINLRISGFPGVEDIDEVIDPYPLFDFFDYKIAR